MIIAPPCRSPLASLMATMFWCGAIARTVSQSMGIDRARRDVVEHVGQRSGVRDGREVGEQTGLLGAGVVGRDDQPVVRTGRLPAFARCTQCAVS